MKIIFNFADVDAGQDWVVRHGRAVGLSVALKVAADKLTLDEFQPRVMKAIYKCIEADRVSDDCPPTPKGR